MTNGAWSVVFYVEENGKSPVREFLVSLDARTQARFLASIE
jgi:DNA-dependent RNA polymerase auxiliary subunit epsilon